EKAIGDLEVVEILLLVGGDLVRREELRLDQQVGQATRRVPSAPRDETEGGVLDEDLRDRVVMDEGQNAGEIAVADEAEKAHHVKDAQIAAKRDGRGIVPWLGRDDAREEALMGVLEARGGVGVARRDRNPPRVQLMLKREILALELLRELTFVLELLLVAARQTFALLERARANLEL